MENKMIDLESVTNYKVVTNCDVKILLLSNKNEWSAIIPYGSNGNIYSEVTNSGDPVYNIQKAYNAVTSYGISLRPFLWNAVDDNTELDIDLKRLKKLKDSIINQGKHPGKMVITEDLHLEKEWHEEAKKQTLRTLPKFIKHLMGDYVHSYGTIVKAMACAAYATIHVCNNISSGGISGLQASYLVWQIIHEMGMFKSESGSRILTFDDMLYPQNSNRFTCIDKDTWDKLQELAKSKLEEDGNIHPDVKKHLQSIVNGIVPFGWKVVDIVY